MKTLSTLIAFNDEATTKQPRLWLFGIGAFNGTWKIDLSDQLYEQYRDEQMEACEDAYREKNGIRV